MLIRQPAQNQTSERILLFLHGFGADAADVFPLAEQMDERFTIYCPNAPGETGFGGLAWFGIDFSTEPKTYDLEAAELAVLNIHGQLIALREERKPKTLLVGGFSQGAMIAFGAIASDPACADGAVLLSGKAFEDFTDMGRPLYGKQFFVSHGTLDDIVPIKAAWETAELLARMGAITEYHEYAIGHGVDADGLTDLNRWLARF